MYFILGKGVNRRKVCPITVLTVASHRIVSFASYRKKTHCVKPCRTLGHKIKQINPDYVRHRVRKRIIYWSAQHPSKTVLSSYSSIYVSMTTLKSMHAKKKM